MKKASAIQKLHHIKSMCSSYDFFLYFIPSSKVDRYGYTLIFLTTLYYTSKYLSRNVVQTVVVFAYVSKSEITFPSAVSWHMIILHWIEKVKKTKWNYYLQEGSNFMPYYIDTISVHYKWDYFKTKKLIRSLSFHWQNKRKSEGTAQIEDK